ncbi:hypothetical protein QRX50_34960 [Amycolatopsis carbonis]|uniref:Tetratricopeptide repeat protein n=1 Tax=Amycolatopsis carbonis TaxID=715471 RepID=A0A9Y2MT97_9PSEU|nr:hypothetical protein [Amycolatopsis sp. 2-15]WIX76628.1 hypothetical protein QRX50_34960 [Amycolatopsis sp. 2-15]
MAHRRFSENLRTLARAEQAVAHFTASIDSWGRADALELQALVMGDLGDPDAATARLRAALELSGGRDEQTTARLRAEIAVTERSARGGPRQ